jgi:uncharacterized protein
MDRVTFQVIGVVFLATLIRSTFGFGEALVAVPLLAFFLPVEIAAPLAVLLSVAVAAVVVAQDWRHVHFRSAGWLTASSFTIIVLALAGMTRSLVSDITPGRQLSDAYYSNRLLNGHLFG